MHHHSWQLVGSAVASPGLRRLRVAGDGSGTGCYMCCGCMVSRWVAAHARRQGCPVMGKSPLCCAGTSSLPPLACPGCSRIDINSSMDEHLSSESFLNGIFIVNVRQVFLLGRNTGNDMLGSHLFVILTCSALPRKSILPFNTENPGQDAPGESPWKEYSFRETAAG